MSTGKYLIAAALAATSFPAIGAVVVVGSSAARQCYESAASPLHPTAGAVARCNDALSNEGTSFDDTVATYVNRGILKLRSGQTDDAIADFDTAMRMNPNQPEAYLNKGAALINQNNPRDALPLFTVALERNTNRPAMAHFGRAMANEDLGNISEAYRDYQRAAQLEPEWPDAQTELARFRVVPR
jgi:tetratricopeptide (TPR) repeat protein